MSNDFARWRAALGYNGMQVAQAAERIGVTGSTKVSALNTGRQELTRTERLAMAAVRAGLSEWSPEADQEIADINELRSMLDRAASRARASAR